MGEENTEQTTEDVKKVDEAEEQRQADAAFEAGFTGQPLEEEEKPANSETTEESTETKENADEDKPPAETPAVLAGLTEDQVKSLLAKASEVDELKKELATTRDKLNGRFGEFNRHLKELQERSHDAPATTAAGLKITADKLKRLSEEYPEIAEILAEDLSDVLSVSAPQGSEDIDARLKSHADEVVGSVNERLADQTLTLLRRDWRDVIATPEFALFRSQHMTPEDREEFDTSWDPFWIHGQIEKFDEWKNAQAKKTEEDAKKAEKEATKNSRLENAVTPRGTSTDHAPSDADAFEAGFRAVRGG